jgi:uncharacterized protein (DUF1499 family)
MLLLFSLGCATAAPAVSLSVTPCPSSPNCVSTADPATDAQHHAAPLSYIGDSAAAKARIKAIVAAMPRTALVAETDEALHFTFTSRIMRYVDDVVFVVRDGKIHFRSSSRVGYGDMGVNRARMDAIAAAWAQGEGG